MTNMFSNSSELKSWTVNNSMWLWDPNSATLKSIKEWFCKNSRPAEGEALKMKVPNVYSTVFSFRPRGRELSVQKGSKYIFISYKNHNFVAELHVFSWLVSFRVNVFFSVFKVNCFARVKVHSWSSPQGTFISISRAFSPRLIAEFERLLLSQCGTSQQPPFADEDEIW